MVATPFSELVGLEVELLLLSCFSSNVLGVTSKKNISVILLESEKKRILPRLSELQIRSLSSRTVNAMRAGKGPVNFLNVSQSKPIDLPIPTVPATAKGNGKV